MGLQPEYFDPLPLCKDRPAEDVSLGLLGCHPVKAVDGDFVTMRAGESVCVGYNHCACCEYCEHGRVHVCRICLAPHRTTEFELLTRGCGKKPGFCRPRVTRMSFRWAPCLNRSLRSFC